MTRSNVIYDDRLKGKGRVHLVEQLRQSNRLAEYEPFDPDKFRDELIHRHLGSDD